MAIFDQFNTGNIYSTIQDNGMSVPPEQILNFIGSQFTITDDPSNFRTNITFPDFLELAGGTMLGNLILNADPTIGLQAATKQYVDSLSAGLSVRTSCVVATTSALTVTYANGASGVGATLTNAGAMAALSIDGVSLSVGNRVLVKNQASQLQNGIYTVTTVGSGAANWVMTRATDYDTTAEVFAGTYTIINSGTVNATNMFVMTQTGTITIGTTAIVFSPFNSAANISVTAPITKTGNVIGLDTPLAATYGGTGISNSNSITLGGNINTAGAFSTSGASALTLTTAGATNVTLPTSGTLVNSAVTTLSSLASIGTITTGVWQGTLIGGTYGGTGINNGASTITIGGNLTYSGGFTTAFTVTGNTSLTLPTSGTLATTAQIPSTPISLANGGTGASLTASNGGIFYSGGSAGAILSGTSTALQILMSGSSSAPAWSTATYPATTTANRILYSSATNTIGQITSAANGVLVTDGSSVPTISSTLPSAVQGNITATGALASGSLATGFTVVTGALGGTGVANTGKTITLGGNLTTSGAFAATFTLSNTTSVTLPVSGTLLANTNNLSDVSSVATSRSNLGVDVCFYQMNIQVFTASGTYTPTSNMVYCIVEAVGGGAGGGGVDASAATGGGGGGGGSGAYGRSVIAAASIGASKAVTIGAGGAGGTAGANNGTGGGTTSLGVLVSASGGSGGTGTAGNAATSSVAGGAGGGSITAGVTIGGSAGGYGWSTGTGVALSGSGGGSLLGNITYGNIAASSSAAGTNAAAYGNGGSGAVYTNNTTDRAGGNGSDGIVIVTEFIKRG